MVKQSTNPIKNFKTIKNLYMYILRLKLIKLNLMTFLNLVINDCCQYPSTAQ